LQTQIGTPIFIATIPFRLHHTSLHRCELQDDPKFKSIMELD